jgi:hypothetical protein
MSDGVHDEYPIDDKPEERERRRQAEADARVWAYIRESLDEHYEQRKVDYDAVFDGLRNWAPDPLEAGLIEAKKTSALVERIAELEKGLKDAIGTLAASRHLMGKYCPDHQWMPEHDRRIDQLKALLSKTVAS